MAFGPSEWGTDDETLVEPSRWGFSPSEWGADDATLTDPEPPYAWAPSLWSGKNVILIQPEPTIIWGPSAWGTASRTLIPPGGEGDTVVYDFLTSKWVVSETVVWTGATWESMSGT